VLTDSPALLRLGYNVWLVSIDGENPGLFCDKGLLVETPAHITSFLNSGDYFFTWPSNFPSRISQFYGSTESPRPVVYLSPGTHTIEVIYLAIRGGISYSTDSMLWEQRYLFEGYTYELTATPTSDGKQIQYGIRRQ